MNEICKSTVEAAQIGEPTAWIICTGMVLAVVVFLALWFNPR